MYAGDEVYGDEITSGEYEDLRCNEPDQDDTVHCCPDCERPNQFGELCMSCQRERDQDDEAAESNLGIVDPDTDPRFAQ